MLRMNILAAFIATVAPAATAQTIEIRTNQQSPMVSSAEQVRIGVNVNVFVPAQGDDGEQALKAQEAGRKMVYELAGRECALLREVLASECRLKSVNVNIQRQNQFGNQSRADGFNVNGNIGFRIAPK